MSTIFGILKKDNKPVDPGDTMKMEQAMNHWNADDSGLYVNHHVMLGNLLLYNTPESLKEKLPFNRGSNCIVADARIDNRDEILNLLKENREISASTPDSVLILYLYEKFGAQCLDFLVGDFAFAIWDGKNQQLFCARDQMGIKPFYFYNDHKNFVFASEKRGLLALPQVDNRINEEYIYMLLADYDPEPVKNFHQNIQLLQPGNMIIVGRDFFTVKVYWELKIPPVLKLASEEEYLEAFREQLYKSVQCRLRSAFPIAAELSGGLDSSGITSMAFRLISDKSRLYTFSNILPVNAKGEKDFLDEENFIDEVLRFNQIEQAVKVTGSGWKHFLERHDLELNTSRGVEVTNASWQEPLRRIMHDKSIRVTLSGFSGDEAITYKGAYYYFGFLEEGLYWEFTKAALRHRKYTLPLTTLVKSVLPSGLKRKINRDRRTLYTPNSYLLDNEIQTRIESDYALDDRVYSRNFREKILFALGRIPASRRIINESIHGIGHKLEPRFPFADIRLLNFFLSMPTAMMGHPDFNRYLFRSAMKGILPEKVRLRDDKIGAAGIYLIQETRKDAPELVNWLKEILGSSGKADMINKIDIPKLIRGLDQSLPENYKDGIFMPTRSFRTELLLRYFTTEPFSGSKMA